MDYVLIFRILIKQFYFMQSNTIIVYYRFDSTLQSSRFAPIGLVCQMRPLGGKLRNGDYDIMSIHFEFLNGSSRKRLNCFVYLQKVDYTHNYVCFSWKRECVSELKL